MEEVKELYIRIFDKGDETVGIEDMNINTSPTVFIVEEEREIFRKELQGAFQVIMDDPQIIFSDEEDTQELFCRKKKSENSVDQS